MRSRDIIDILEQHGLRQGRLISASKSGYRERHPEHFVVFNARVFWRRGPLLHQADLDLTIDAAALTAGARAAGENLYVLCERHALGDLKPVSVSRLLRDALWWTRIHPGDQDEFRTLNLAPWRRRPSRLSCTTGVWKGRPAYSLDFCGDAEAGGLNMCGAAVQISGQPPEGIFQEEPAPTGEQFSVEASTTRGRPVRPVFYHRISSLEYVWFSNFVAVPWILYRETVAYWGPVNCTWHRGHSAIHMRRSGEIVGFTWPATILAPQIIASAREHLRALPAPHRGSNANARGDNRTGDTRTGSVGVSGQRTSTLIQ